MCFNDLGTCEQFHHELKTDMNLEKYPSRKNAANDLILNIMALVFYCLQIVGSVFLASCRGFTGNTTLSVAAYVP